MCFFGVRGILIYFAPKIIVRKYITMENTKQIVSIISSIFVIIIITKIVEFLKSVPSCQCAKITDTGILDKIVFLEKFIIGLMVIQILRKVFEMSSSSSPIKIDKIAKMNSPINLFLFAIAFLVYIFFIYNVNNFKDALAASTGSTESCECVDKWEKTALYIQAIIYMIVVSVISILGIFLVNISLTKGTGSNFTNVMVLLIFSVVGLGIWSLYGGDMNVFLEYAMDVIPQSNEGFGCNYKKDKERFENDAKRMNIAQ